LLSGILLLAFVELHNMLSKVSQDILSYSAAVEREGKWEMGSIFQGGSATVFSFLQDRGRNSSPNDL